MSHSIESRPAAAAAAFLRLISLFVLAAPLSGCGRAGGREAAAGTTGGRPPAVPDIASEHRPKPSADQAGTSYPMRFTRAGTAIEAELAPIGARGDREGGNARAGDDVRFRVRISDAATGRPMTGVKPAAWLAARVEGEPRDAGSLTHKIAALARGDPLASPELDLNQFYVVALNDDATVMVVDPRFGFGGSRLLSLVPLPGVGDDWVYSSDADRLFVSIPTAGRVVAIDTKGWTIAGSAEIPHPTRLALQEDGHFLWVASAMPGGSGGVAAVEVATLRIAARVETGIGPHDIAFGRDDLRVYVTNRKSGTLTVIDARRQGRVGDVQIGPGPVAVAVSSASGAAYVVDAEAGTLAIVAGDPPSLINRLAIGPGACSIGFAPGGRIGLITRPGANEVITIDAAVDRIQRRVETEAGPDQLAFTDRVAYVRQAGSPMLRLLPIDGLASPSQPPSAIDIPIGRSAPGRAMAPAAAAAIARASAEDAVLVANPADQAIYYYKEGLSAPQGSFRAYGHVPVAVLAVDRSLRSAAPGVYETTARLRRPGRFDLAIFLDNPRIVHCFEIEVADDPRRPPSPPLIEAHLVDDASPIAGQPCRLQLKLEEQRSGRPVAGKSDVQVLATLPGRWQHSFPAVPQPDDGTYAFDFTPPRAGLYVLYVESVSSALASHGPRALHLQVKEPPR
jgi:YVTN family beta-propeller protein